MQRNLLATGDRPLAETSPYDSLWGIGGVRAIHAAAQNWPSWRDEIFLGTILQRVRSLLRNAISQGSGAPAQMKSPGNWFPPARPRALRPWARVFTKLTRRQTRVLRSSKV